MKIFSTYEVKQSLWMFVCYREHFKIILYESIKNPVHKNGLALDFGSEILETNYVIFNN
jgi:hypothetical protein